MTPASTVSPAVLESQTPSKRDRVLVRNLYIVITVMTVFDAVASWISIQYLGLAYEANAGLDFISNFIGFSGAMIFRVLWGLGASLLLAYLAINFKTAKRRRFATRGMWLIVVVLSALTVYQIYILIASFATL